MPDLDEQLMERMLKGHLSARLDSQLGRAAQVFDESQRFWRLSALTRWVAGGLAAAAAIVFAVYVSITAMRNPGVKVITQQDPRAPGPTVTQVSAPVPLRESFTWRSFDEGTVHLADNTPARKVRRQSVQQVQWYDPNRKQVVRATIPRENVEYVRMERY